MKAKEVEPAFLAECIVGTIKSHAESSFEELVFDDVNDKWDYGEREMHGESRLVFDYANNRYKESCASIINARREGEKPERYTVYDIEWLIDDVLYHKYDGYSGNGSEEEYILFKELYNISAPLGLSYRVSSVLNHLSSCASLISETNNNSAITCSYIDEDNYSFDCKFTERKIRCAVIGGDIKYLSDSSSNPRVGYSLSGVTKKRKDITFDGPEDPDSYAVNDEYPQWLVDQLTD